MSKTSVTVNGERFEVEVLERKREFVTFRLNDRTYRVEFESLLPVHANGSVTGAGEAGAAVSAPANASGRALNADKPGAIVTPIPGVVVEVLVAVGDKIEHGQNVARVEAMKMQNNVFSPVGGTVTAIHVAPGQEVLDGDVLMVTEPSP